MLENFIYFFNKKFLFYLGEKFSLPPSYKYYYKITSIRRKYLTKILIKKTWLKFKKKMFEDKFIFLKIKSNKK
jgi:hypothetical protein